MSERGPDHLVLLSERLKILYRQLPLVYGATLIVAPIVANFLYGRSANPWLMAWLAAIVAMTAIRVVSYFWSKPFYGVPEKAILLARVIFLGSAASGCLWGALGVISYDSGDLVALVIVTIILCGFTAGSVSSLSAHLPTYCSYAIPALMPLIVRIAMSGDDGTELLAYAGLVFLMVNLIYARDYQRALSDTIRLRFERQQLIEDLTAEKQRVEVASKAKSRFFAAISHDLRQPVHAIGLLNDGLTRGTDVGHVQRVSEGIRLSLDGLDDLLNRFLDISKIEAGVVKAEITAMKIQSLFDRIEAEFAPQAAQKKIDLRIVRTNAVVASDPVLMTRIMRNLVFNAIRYTAHGGVLIGCRPGRTGDGAPALRLCVVDTGPGIPPERQSKVFDEFYAVHEPGDAKGGVGLGLAIARGLARAIGGDVTLASNLGRGSAFTVTIPLYTAVVQAEQAAALAHSPVSMDGRVVLVVDDDATILDALCEVVASWGCLIIRAASAEAAIAAVGASARQPDVALLDHRLPGGRTGAQLLSELDRLLGRPLPAAIVSGDTALQLAQSDIDPARGAPSLILHKPVQPMKLRLAMNTLLGR